MLCFHACNWLKCAASTGVGIAGVGITGVGITGVGITGVGIAGVGIAGASRFPEAIPLKDIHTSTAAEALLEIFSRVGLPNKIHSDRGSQFTSDMGRYTDC